jgi:hypothetical protein
MRVKTVIRVKCVQCGKVQDVGGEVARDDYPMCDTCFVPMIVMAVKRTLIKGKE